MVFAGLLAARLLCMAHAQETRTPPNKKPTRQTPTLSIKNASGGPPKTKYPPARATNQTLNSTNSFPTALVYRPPRSGMPAVRVGAGSRGTADLLPALDVLAPRATGWTTKAQPNLYCYASKAVSTNVEFTLIIPGQSTLVIETNLANGLRAGINTIELARYGIELRPDTEYKWSISLVLDPESPSRDKVTSGVIQRILPSDELSRKLAQAKAFDRPLIYAQEGLWYDAADWLLGLLAITPMDEGLLRRLDELLSAEGLGNVKYKP